MGSNRGLESFGCAGWEYVTIAGQAALFQMPGFQMNNLSRPQDLDFGTNVGLGEP
jgi:hypothetical protein